MLYGGNFRADKDCIINSDVDMTWGSWNDAYPDGMELRGSRAMGEPPEAFPFRASAGVPRLHTADATEPGPEIIAACLRDMVQGWRAMKASGKLPDLALALARAERHLSAGGYVGTLASEPGPDFKLADLDWMMRQLRAPPPPGSWPPFHPTRLAVAPDLYPRLARLTVEGPVPSLFDALPVTVDEALPPGTGCYTGPDPSALGGVGVALFRIEGDRVVIAGSGGEDMGNDEPADPDRAARYDTDMPTERPARMDTDTLAHAMGIPARFLREPTTPEEIADAAAWGAMMRGEEEVGDGE